MDDLSLYELLFISAFKKYSMGSPSFYQMLAANSMIELKAPSEGVKYEQGAEVYPQDTFMDKAYLVMEGILKIYRTGSNGKQYIVRLAKVGDLIAYHSIVAHEPEATACLSLTPSVLCPVSAADLNKAIANDQELAMAVLKLSCFELKEAQNAMLELSQINVRGRLAGLLVKLQQLFSLEQGQEVPVKLSRQDISVWIGTTKESVSRLMTEFRQSHLIDTSNNQLRILNKAELDRLSKYC